MSSKTEAVLITGGSKRLGLKLALKSLDMGYTVIIHHNAELSEPSKEILKSKQKDRVIFLQHDLTKTPEKLLEHALTFPVKIIGLVNNASVFIESDLSDIHQFENILQINALAPARLSSFFFKSITHGWIINITDSNIQKPNHKYQNYRISKILLQELTRQQAFTFAPHIRVNAIAPGAMLPAQSEDEHYFQSLTEKIPLRTTGDTNSFLKTYEFLVNTPYITGETILVDGGWHLTA